MTRLMIPTTTGLLGARNPVVKVVAATVPAVLLIASRDAVTPALVLGLTVLALPAVEMSVRALLRWTWPLVLAAISVGAVNAVFGVDGVGSGVALGLRALGLALPGVLVLSTTDPLDLADSLVQQLHAPPKFAYGTLGALRLLPLLGQEWQVIAMARRARGVDAGRNPLVAVQLFTSQVLALLVSASVPQLAAVSHGRICLPRGRRSWSGSARASTRWSWCLTMPITQTTVCWTSWTMCWPPLMPDYSCWRWRALSCWLAGTIWAVVARASSDSNHSRMLLCASSSTVWSWVCLSRPGRRW